MADARLTVPAASAIDAADSVLVSPISFFEIAQKVRIGKWPEMARHVDVLQRLLEEQGGSVAELDPAICVAAGIMAWDHRDPFDRLLAATAKHLRLPIVSADEVFDGVVTRVW
jgi:PIN domain nuclease of toxin-antitoxin system